MTVHHRGETTLLDFFVAVPGLDGTPRTAELEPIDVVFDAETTQTFFVGPVSCGVPGTPAGLVEALRRFGSMPLEELVEAGDPARPRGRPGEPRAGLHPEDPGADPGAAAGDARALRAARGGRCARGRRSASRSSRWRSNASPPRAWCRSTAARWRRRCRTSWSSTAAPWGAATSPPTRRSSAPRCGPTSAAPRCCTNPPPSAGGTLIAYSLDLLERLGPTSGPEQLVEAMDAANRHRADLLGSTTHISVIDAEGMCAAVTCSNGSGSGVLVPGTGVILNNMLGEEDLNPFGFHQGRAGLAGDLDDGADRGPARRRGDPRGRQRRLQPDPLGDPADGGAGGRAGDGPGGGDRRPAPALRGRRGAGRAGDRRRRRWPGWRRAASTVARRPEINLFFGGVQAVARDPETGELSGGGDPRRGGAVAYA